MLGRTKQRTILIIFVLSIQLKFWMKIHKTNFAIFSQVCVGAKNKILIKKINKY